MKNLAVAWAFQTGDYGDSLQSTPIVIDGVMYVSTSYAQVFALDAATGRLIWRYKYPTAGSVGRSGGEAFRINRGLAVSDGKVFSRYARQLLVAIDQKTGRELWSVNVDDSQPMRMQHHVGAAGGEGQGDRRRDRAATTRIAAI